MVKGSSPELSNMPSGVTKLTSLDLNPTPELATCASSTPLCVSTWILVGEKSPIIGTLRCDWSHMFINWLFFFFYQFQVTHDSRFHSLCKAQNHVLKNISEFERLISHEKDIMHFTTIPWCKTPSIFRKSSSVNKRLLI